MRWRNLPSPRRLRRTARRYSLCADDADDAYQRAVEILLTNAERLLAPGAGHFVAAAKGFAEQLERFLVER